MEVEGGESEERGRMERWWRGLGLEGERVEEKGRMQGMVKGVGAGGWKEGGAGQDDESEGGGTQCCQMSELHS